MAAAVAAALALGSCGEFARDVQIVDGWSIGERVEDCRSERPVITSCEELVALARDAVGADDTVGGLVFVEGAYRNAAGDDILSNRGGLRQLVVVLEDTSGRRRAVGVLCGFTDCSAGGEPAYRP